MGLSQSTLGGGFGPQPEYSGREFWASARVLWEEVFGLSQSTLGKKVLTEDYNLKEVTEESEKE